jgi:hypothetical protein
MLEAVAQNMRSNEPYLLAAMDGQDTASDDVKQATLDPLRKEPCAMFFVIFGLIFEALSTASVAPDSSNSTQQPATVAAFRALQSIVAPQFSGQALMEQTTFKELIGLCYRIAMTESASMQLHLIAALSALATVEAGSDNMYVTSSILLAPSNSVIQHITECFRLQTLFTHLLLRCTACEFVHTSFDGLEMENTAQHLVRTRNLL